MSTENEKANPSITLDISREEAHEILGYQFDTHHHIQSQAQNTLRFIVASLTVILALSISVGSYETPSSPIQSLATLRALTEADVIATFENWNPGMIYTLQFYSVILFIFCLGYLRLVIRSKNLKPGVETNKISNFRVVINPTAIQSNEHLTRISTTNRTISEWVNWNSEIIRREQENLTKGLSNLTWCLLLLLVSLLLHFFGSEGALVPILIIYIAVLFPIFAVVVMFLQSFWMFRIKSPDEIYQMNKVYLANVARMLPPLPRFKGQSLVYPVLYLPSAAISIVVVEFYLSIFALAIWEFLINSFI